MKLTSLCVYCGSSMGTAPAIMAAADRFGGLMAASGVELVYGGGGIGVMGALARAVLAEGGKVTGIIPKFLTEVEAGFHEVSELIITDSMHERKQLMFERSQAFVALPGGIGTVEETIEMLTWAQLGRHSYPIVIEPGGLLDAADRASGPYHQGGLRTVRHTPDLLGGGQG